MHTSILNSEYSYYVINDVIAEYYYYYYYNEGLSGRLAMMTPPSCNGITPRHRSTSGNAASGCRPLHVERIHIHCSTNCTAKISLKKNGLIAFDHLPSRWSIKLFMSVNVAPVFPQPTVSPHSESTQCDSKVTWTETEYYSTTVIFTCAWTAEGSCFYFDV